MAIVYRQDPVLFTYGTWQNQTCSTLPSDIREFHQSDLSPSGCMAWKDFLGNDEPAVAVFVLETPTNGECQVEMFSDDSCTSTTPTVLTSLHCANGNWESFSLNKCQ
ncbi:hypothetical protein MGN70_004023 [Eutypa lata]|nr:hypothetical protein MGN70_004023 [Eutypa lata]